MLAHHVLSILTNQPVSNKWKQRIPNTNVNIAPQILDVNMLLRKAACASTPKMEVKYILSDFEFLEETPCFAGVYF